MKPSFHCSKMHTLTNFTASMASILLLFMLSYFANLSQSIYPTYLYHNCSSNATFTPKSVYQSNLNALLSNLSSQAKQGNPFYQMKVGTDNPDSNNTAYGIYLCRGDLNASVCRDCAVFGAEDVAARCPVKKEAVIWYDECMLRYSNRSFFNTVDVRPRIALLNTHNATEPDKFRYEIEKIMNESARAVENEAKRFLTKEIRLSGFQTIYTLMQCTPDISGADCTVCLRSAISRLSICCAGKIGGRVLYPSCNVRYELYPFYGLTTPEESNPAVRNTPPPPPSSSPPPPPPPRAPGNTRQISNATIVAIVATITLISLALGACCLYHHRRLKANKYNVVQRENEGIESLQFDLITVENATKNFSRDNKLGEGGFGEVYKGILAEGQEIAVKRLSKSSGQGAQEFKNEVALVAKLQHRNLVRLLGFCLERGETILVYEFVPNKSLDYSLFDPKMQGLLDWPIRCKIMSGIARGILYLHEDSRLRVIHRDLKASNILLDGDMNPKISDFGMAKMVGFDQTEGNTKRIVGTYGYMAPEYAMEGLYSVKSDVFSFGILLLEILSGKKNSGFHQTNCAPSLLTYAWNLWNEGKVLDLVDPTLKDSFLPNEFMRHVHIGLLCVQEEAYNRPTMLSVVQMLTTETISLPMPDRPAFSVGRFRGDHHHDQDLGLVDGCSDNGLTISVFGPR